MAYNETPDRKAIAMFNRNVQVSFPKKPADSKAETTPNPYSDPQVIIPMAKDLVLEGTKLGVAVYAGIKILNTACDIAKIAAHAKL